MEDYMKERLDNHEAHVDKRFDRLEDLFHAHGHGDKVGWAALISILVPIALLVIGSVVL